MSTETDTLQRLRAFILKKFPRARTQNLHDDDSLLESGIVDSLGVLDLVGFVENEFGITVSDEELQPENFRSVSSLTQFVKSKKSNTAGSL